MNRKHIEAARYHARTELLGQYDWRDMAIAANDDRPAREALLRKVLALSAEGLTVPAIAKRLGTIPSAIEALLEGSI
jgi:hypothetical protein